LALQLTIDAAINPTTYSRVGRIDKREFLAMAQQNDRSSSIIGLTQKLVHGRTGPRFVPTAWHMTILTSNAHALELARLKASHAA
jgi:hypothetical protein